VTETFTMLKMAEGDVRLTCTDCAEFLHGCGMLDLIAETRLMGSEVPKLGPAIVKLYCLAPGVTLEDTRRAVKERHR